jgi:hypothetical protein
VVTIVLSFGMWRCVGLMRTDVLEEHVTSSRLVCLANANAAPCLQILSTLKMKTACSSEISVLTIPTWHHIPGDSTSHIHATCC